MAFKTTDLCDRHPGVQIAEPVFSDFGGTLAFHGAISTVRCHEDNSLVRAALETPGEGRVLVVDGGASLRCALIGDELATLASDNGWAGAIVYGCVRDAAELASVPFGLKALAAHPLRSRKHGEGARDVSVRFADVTFEPGHYLYADEDGVIVAPAALSD